MFTDSVADYIEGVAAKHLRAVDAVPAKSNQHEIGGLPSVGFKQYLGEPPKGESRVFNARMVYITDFDDAPLSLEDVVTWYDARHEKRSPEYRLYYKSNAVTKLLGEGDFFLIAKLNDGSLLMVFCPPGSTVESQLCSIFSLSDNLDEFSTGSTGGGSLLLPVRLLLEELGFVKEEPVTDDSGWLDRLIATFDGEKFPGTGEFSAYARDTIGADQDPVSDPDSTLMAWMNHEEFLFRIYERHLVQERLKTGFGEDVDSFIDYSLSVQNRRKSRVGHAFEGHLESLFRANGLKFERARGKSMVTENNSKPDFIFPGFASYQDPDYPEMNLIMLGAKTTCKDRWRQVLAEANRIERKHLVTLEPGISTAQTDQMISTKLQLVVPSPLHATYTAGQRTWLHNIQAFINEVRQRALIVG